MPVVNSMLIFIVTWWIQFCCQFGLLIVCNMSSMEQGDMER